MCDVLSKYFRSSEIVECSKLPVLQKNIWRVHNIPGGVLPEKLGGGVRPASQNPYPIYDQNLRYSLPYLWPDQKFEALFITLTLYQNPVSDLRYNWISSSDQC